MRKSRISQAKQDRLIEHFIAGTTARTAASLVGVHRNSAAFYFHRLREVIAYELEAESEAMFGGEIEIPSRQIALQSLAGRRTRATSAASAKVNADVARREKSRCLAYLSAVERFTPASSLMPLAGRLCPSLSAR